MGLIGRIVSFTRGERGFAKKADVVVDPGSQANVTGENFDSPGVDAQPALHDIPLLVALKGGKRFAVVGYIDPLNEGLTEAGEHRIYGRIPIVGIPISSVWCKGDGTVLINDIAAFDVLGNLVTTGNISGAAIIASGIISAASIAATGAITAASIAATGAVTGLTVLAGAISLTTHTHSVTTAPGTTGPAQ